MEGRNIYFAYLSPYPIIIPPMQNESKMVRVAVPNNEEFVYASDKYYAQFHNKPLTDSILRGAQEAERRQAMALHNEAVAERLRSKSSKSKEKEKEK